MRRLLALLSPSLLVALALAACPGPTDSPLAAHFPLVGLHEPLTCTACHGESLEDPQPSECAGCHEDARPDDHYDGECGDCHSEAGWPFAVADHSFFPLIQGHAAPICTDCHQDETDFTNVPRTCEGCHERDRPAGHFEGGCADCHGLAGWERPDFDHRRFFPVPHEGVRECASCHPAAPDYEVFTCTDCHAHRRSEMDDEHRGETNNYRYESSACLACHPDGEDD